ncbi:MAG: TackOD1 domain-containing metal-binding protein [Candidatus Helarchaeales archaeon]
MPKGIAIIKWDDHFGAMLDAVYPKDLQITSDLVLQLYTSQTMGDISTPRFSIFQTKEIKIASYFGGDRKNLLLVFILGEDEDPEKFQLLVIQTFNDLITNDVNTEEFVEQAYKRITEMGSQFSSISILENRIIQKFFANVIADGVREFKPKKDFELGIYYPRLNDYLEVEPSQAEIFIDYLIRQEFIIPEVVDNVLVCPFCGSIRLLNLVTCAKCNSNKIEKGLTARHRYCGYRDFYQRFFDKQRNRLYCRNCNTFIMDEKDLINQGISYYCVDCHIFSKKPDEIVECQNCNRRFNKDALIFKEINQYTVNLEKIKLILKFQGGETSGN